MYRRLVLFAAVASLGLVVVGTEWAAVPAPPVNQNIGMHDVLYGELTEADCRACHDSGLPDRHHCCTADPFRQARLSPIRTRIGTACLIPRMGA